MIIKEGPSRVQSFAPPFTLGNGEEGGGGGRGGVAGRGRESKARQKVGRWRGGVSERFITFC